MLMSQEGPHAHHGDAGVFSLHNSRPHKQVQLPLNPGWGAACDSQSRVPLSSQNHPSFFFFFYWGVGYPSHQKPSTTSWWQKPNQVCPKHSITTLHTKLTQHMLPKPLSYIVLIAPDINKAFNIVLHHILIEKIINTTRQNNDKWWLKNFLSGCQAYGTYNNTTSKICNLLVEYPKVPIYATLSPTSFYMTSHHLP